MKKMADINMDGGQIEATFPTGKNSTVLGDDVCIPKPAVGLSQSKLYKIEALRGLAAVYVVLHHSLPDRIMLAGINIGELARFGQEAVILFFLLSGFVIKYSYTKTRNKTFGNYFQKRALRIYVPLIAVFFVGFASKSYNAGTWISIDLGTLTGNLFMLQDWARARPNVIVEPFLNNGPLWSLAYEWWFYMLFFPITLFVRSEKTRDIGVFVAAILAAVVYVAYPLFVLRIIMYLAIWWTGVIMAQRYLEEERLSIRQLRFALVALSCILIILMVDVYLEFSAGVTITLGHHPFQEVRHFGFTLVAVMSAFAWRSYGWYGFDTLIKPFAFFAPISYAIYISHYHVIVDATYLDIIPNPIVRWFAYFAVLLAVSYLIELKLYPMVRNWVTSRRVPN